jgi:hypothetical protein
MAGCIDILAFRRTKDRVEGFRKTLYNGTPDMGVCKHKYEITLSLTLSLSSCLSLVCAHSLFPLSHLHMPRPRTNLTFVLSYHHKTSVCVFPTETHHGYQGWQRPRQGHSPTDEP